jgi:diadenosine tetraphosphate (Ap4A) HIT family hydrolase
MGPARRAFDQRPRDERATRHAIVVADYLEQLGFLIQRDHMALISERVEQARAGSNPMVIKRMASGWAVMGDVQFLPGYSLLLPDPVVHSLNSLAGAERVTFLSDMAMLGDAILEATQAERINYEILGNTEPELHAHLFPRYAHEPDERRRMPVWFYDWKSAPRFSPEVHSGLKERILESLEKKMCG